MLSRLVIYTLLALGSWAILNSILTKFSFTRKNYTQSKYAIAIILMVFAFQLSAVDSLSMFFKNSESYEKTTLNFHNPIPEIITNEAPLDVIVYIGESTSVMNMNLYGYPRNTTPQLNLLAKEDANLIPFFNVFSTHTHTSPSLLEALSFGLSDEDKFLPINQRKRLSIVDILKSAGVDTYLYSNQGQTGTWNQASSIIFKSANRTFSTDSQLAGNRENKIKKPWDHDFYEKNLINNVSNKPLRNKSITFFHSYAGHGSYLDNIPVSYHEPVDNYFRNRNPKSIIGSDKSHLNKIEAYDSAIRYIDFSVAKAINSVKSNNKPIVFIYFADHGDAVYPNIGHDSSRFIHEMARVPFLIYFNEAAKSAYPQLYLKYSELAKAQEIATLAQLPSTVFDLLGIEIKSDKSKPIIQTKLIGEPTNHPPIIVRETAQAITFINLNKQAFNKKSINNKTLLDVTDDATNIFVTRQNNKNYTTAICYHRSNTIGKAIRAALVSSCIESDIMVDEDSSIHVYHPPAENTGLELKDVFAISQRGHYAMWLDSKNIQSQHNCSSVLSFLEESAYSEMSLLVEFPSGSHSKKPEIMECALNLKKLGVATSYYIPTKIAKSCAEAIRNNKLFNEVESCNNLREDVLVAANSDLFTDFSFDYSGMLAIEGAKLEPKFKWNTWNVHADEFAALNPNQFRMIIFSNKDPNNI